jgi:hypothetical protein
MDEALTIKKTKYKELTNSPPIPSKPKSTKYTQYA